MDKQAILDVLNSLEVIEQRGGKDPYILVANNEENRAKLNAVGVSDEIIKQYGDDESFCILGLAFNEGYADDFVDGKLIIYDTVRRQAIESNHKRIARIRRYMMDREIKFRAWSNKHNHMFRVSEISLNRDGYVHGLIDHESEDEYNPDFNNPFVWIGRVDFVPSKNGEKAGLFQKQEDEPFVLMQYTGLKDRNGIEIYEGDILDGSYVNPMTNEVVKKHYVVVFENGSYYAKLIGHHPYGTTLLYFAVNAVVIGNIYEHSHLLEGVS